MNVKELIKDFLTLYHFTLFLKKSEGVRTKSNGSKFKVLSFSCKIWIQPCCGWIFFTDDGL